MVGMHNWHVQLHIKPTPYHLDCRKVFSEKHYTHMSTVKDLLWLGGGGGRNGERRMRAGLMADRPAVAFYGMEPGARDVPSGSKT